jgi:hypothetical protein
LNARGPGGWRARAVLLAAAPVLALPAARAEMVDIAWNAAGRFEHRFVVAPGKFAEACGALVRGQAVRWSFESPAPLNFNIHYHVGEKVEYPVRRDAVARAEGTLEATLDQDFCWMWTNKGSAPLNLQVRLSR